MQSTDIATEVPSPITALSPFRPTITKRTLIFVLLVAVCHVGSFGLGYEVWNHGLRSHSQEEIMSEKIGDLGCFYEPRAQLYFQIDLQHGTGAMVDLEDVKGTVKPQIKWLAAYTWYFQDLATGMCYAMVRHPHLNQGSPVPVPCWHIPFLNRVSTDNRWRYEDLPTTAP